MLTAREIARLIRYLHDLLKDPRSDQWSMETLQELLKCSPVGELSIQEALLAIITASQQPSFWTWTFTDVPINDGTSWSANTVEEILHMEEQAVRQLSVCYLQKVDAILGEVERVSTILGRMDDMFINDQLKSIRTRLEKIDPTIPVVKKSTIIERLDKIDAEITKLAKEERHAKLEARKDRRTTTDGIVSVERL